MNGGVINEHAALGHHLLDMGRLKGYATYQRTQVSITSSGNASA
jgi:hypothetical protein